MIKGTAILGIALCITALMRRRSAAQRHMVLSAAIISAALLPLLSPLLPSWQSHLAADVVAALPALTRTHATEPPVDDDHIAVRALGIDSATSLLPTVLVGVWIIGSLLAFIMLARE